MGKFYSRHGRNLYIYLVQDDSVVDLDIFPDELNLFDSEAAWRIKNNMAIVNDADESDIDKAEIILSLNSFKRWDHAEEALERYFALGDESVLGFMPLEIQEVAVELAEEELPEMEVIIPEAMSTPMVSQTEKVETAQDEVITPPSTSYIGPPITPKIAPYTDKQEQYIPVSEREVAERPRPEREEGPIERVMLIDDVKGFYSDLAYSRFYPEISLRLENCFKHIDAHWREIEPTLRVIAQSPHHSISKRRVMKPIDSVESIDPALLESIASEFRSIRKLKGEKGAPQDSLFSNLPLRVTVEEEHPDYDTVENRIVKFHLKALYSRLGDLSVAALEMDEFLRRCLKKSEAEETIETAREFLINHEMILDIEKLKEKMEGFQKEPPMAFLKEVSENEGPFPITETLESHIHYGRLYSHLKSYEENAPPPLIRLGLIALQDLGVSDLYARWCVVKVSETLKKMGYKIESEGLVWLEGDEVRVNEIRQFELSREGTRIRITFERLYDNERPYGSYSTPKKAKIALEVFKGDAVPSVIVFEPRYDPEYTEDKFRVEDLDTLHVLHDSIVDLRTDRRERLVIGGFVFHPSAMKTVIFGDLGAIPIKPGVRNYRLDAILVELMDRA
jgi:hypothetical protein